MGMTTRRAFTVALAALAVGAAGCGGGGDRHARGATVDPAELNVVRAWADTLRSGDARGAARYFAVPSVVANGGPPTTLSTIEAVRFFNETLPCGAKVIGAAPARRGFFVVTFELTSRPGGSDCGHGATNTARTAFRVRGGRITDWIRVEDLRPAPSAEV